MNLHEVEEVRYEEIEPHLDTGDLILFHGESRRSRIIETVTRSEFSHVGMVVRLEGKLPLIWQSDPRPVTQDVELREHHGGAQLNELAAALDKMTSPEYGDTPFVRQLVTGRTPRLNAAVLEAIEELDAVSFPSLLRVLRKWFLGHLHVRASGKRMYCAEVVAVTYQRMGLLSAEPPANAYAPADFTADHDGSRWIHGASLGPLRKIVLPVARSGAG